jgi:2-polyprenyl-3-methyl-5-hydroxy-6-metoxy-1,4-benzoquinol methylase
LNYIQCNFSPKKLVAFDVKLHSTLLQQQWILPFESDLNQAFVLPEQADLILCTAVLEHLDNPVDFLKQAYKNLVVWWCLVLTVPSVWSKPVLEFLAFKLKLIDALEIRDHKQYYTKKKLMEYLRDAWFNPKNIHHHYFEIYMNNFVLVKK